MSNNFIVVGDTTVSGGSVIAGSPFTDIDGLPVARQGDPVVCSQHGSTTIASGDPTTIIDGQPVARHMLDACACGCKLMSAKQMHVFVDAGGGGGSATAAPKSAAALQAAAIAAAAAAVQSDSTKNSDAYDEAIRFVSATGDALANVEYVLHLEGGERVEGRTDNQGVTSRVATSAPQKIVKAELRSEPVPCCALHAEKAGSEPETLVIDVDGVLTNSTGFAVSIQEVTTPDGDARQLTPGEIAMARLVFGDSINYEKVKVHNGEYLWFGMQPDNTAMTPKGEMYFNSKYFKEDFSNSSDINGQQWFIHEMTHVWQYQLGYPVKWRGAVRVGLSYDYTLSFDKRLSDYNMEAQGNIVADYFILNFRNRQTEMYEEKYWFDSDALVRLNSVLEDFLKDSSNAKNLP